MLSLYLFVGHVETDIKISQLVSVFAIIFGVWTLAKIYRKEIHALYKKMFKNDYDEVSKSRWILLGVTIALFAVGVTMCVLCGAVKSANGKGGESYLIAGVVLLAAALYSGLGVWSLFDRLKVYDAQTGDCVIEQKMWQTDNERLFTAVICYGVIMGALFVFGLFSLIKWGIVDKIPNGTVLFVACLGCITAIALSKFVPGLKQFLKLNKQESVSSDNEKASSAIPAEGDSSAEQIGEANTLCSTEQEGLCGSDTPQPSDNGQASEAGADGCVPNPRLNKFLLFVFPPKVYQDYGVSHLKPYVDPDKDKKKEKKAAKRNV